MAKERRYYSLRTGEVMGTIAIDLEKLREFFYTVYLDCYQKGYLQESWGYHCVDEGKLVGTLGDVERYILLNLRKEHLWPVHETYHYYSEEDIFDMLEFMYDCISKPIHGKHHTWNNCGWHYATFDKEAGQSEFRNEVNKLLRDYKDGFELSERGEVLSIPDPSLKPLLEAPISSGDPNNVDNRVKSAVLKFRKHNSSPEDKREAIRELADVFEFLRPRVKAVLTEKDEADLFNIANSFAIRHHNPKQKTGYDKSIWYSWMFYFFLASIHAAVRLLQRGPSSGEFRGHKT